MYLYRASRLLYASIGAFRLLCDSIGASRLLPLQGFVFHHMPILESFVYYVPL